MEKYRSHSIPIGKILAELSDRRWLALLPILLAGFITACSTEPVEPKLEIKIVANNWASSEVNAEIARQLIAANFDYQVEIVRLDENAQWAEIAQGDAHISLEVWPSAHRENVQEYIEKQATVEFAGFLGPIGQVNWYVPAYMIEKYPSLARWDGYLNPELAELFSTAETDGAGQLLSIDPNEFTFDEAIIQNLGLPLKVVYAGSEDAILAGAEAAMDRKDPVLFYLWTPHYFHAKYDLVPVELPQFYLGCYDNPAAVDCRYPEETLFKIVWYLLDEEAPDVYTFITRMEYALQDQVAILGAIEAEEITAAAAAREWIADNEAIWETWLP
ncbi:MAG: glycine betaine ABC transporter substrate-binding protein [Chloroflexota bacterium]